MHHPTDRITHTTAFVTPVEEHWLKREIAQWVHPMKDRSDDPSHHERTLLPQSYISFRTVPKHPRPIMVETAVHFQHWIFDKRLANVINQFEQDPIGGNRNSIPTNINWAGKLKAMIFLTNLGARCSSWCDGSSDRSFMVELLFLFQPVLHYWFITGRGMCYAVCGIMHKKEPLLLIGKSSPCGGSGFPLSLSKWSFTIYLTPYNCNKMCWVRR